jgi:Na+-transporting methylmalonyl-CoA/oxaloacetate decarboxylase gamma subunit
MGLLIVNVVILIAGAALLGIGGSFGSNAAVKVSQIPNYTQDNDLNSAHTYLKTGALIAWITVGVLIVTGILLLIFSQRAGAFKWVITIMLFLTAVASIVVGALFVVAAGRIDQSPLIDINANPATNARIGGWMAIGSGILVLILAIIVIVVRQKSPVEKRREKQQRIAAAERNVARNQTNIAAREAALTKSAAANLKAQQEELDNARAKLKVVEEAASSS